MTSRVSVRMHQLRAALVVVLSVLALPSTAHAEVDSLTVSGARLGPEGTTFTVTLAYRCRVGFNVTFGSVAIARSTGRKLAQGSGSFINRLPFKLGRASAPSLTFTVCNPQTSNLVTETAGPIALPIRKK
jgi:hypothetical protein